MTLYETKKVLKDTKHLKQSQGKEEAGGHKLPNIKKLQGWRNSTEIRSLTLHTANLNFIPWE